MEAFLSVVGSVASIFGAWWALREARRAKTSADSAERVHRELIGRRKIAEIAQIQFEIKRVLSIVAQVGPTSTPQLVRGLNCAAIARQVEVLAAQLLEARGHFSDLYSNRATELRSDLRADIEGLAEAKTFDEKKRCGKNIYYKIENFAPVVKELVDERAGQLPTL